MTFGGIRLKTRLPGVYTGIYEVLGAGEPCSLLIRRQHGGEWLVETEDEGFLPVSTLPDAVAFVRADEVRRVQEASAKVAEFIALLRKSDE